MTSHGVNRLQYVKLSSPICATPLKHRCLMTQNIYRYNLQNQPSPKRLKLTNTKFRVLYVKFDHTVKIWFTVMSGQRWIPSQRTSNAELNGVLSLAWTRRWTNNRVAGDFRHLNVHVPCL